MSQEDSAPDRPSRGLSRRDLIKRGAIVGGVAVWATPVVSSIASTALAQPAGSGVPVQSTGSNISWFAVVAKCGSTYSTLVVSQGTILSCNNPPTNGDNSGAGSAWLTLVGGSASNSQGSCSVFGTPVVTDSGDTVTVSLAAGVAGCEIVGWVLHDGGCSSLQGSHTFSSLDTSTAPTNDSCQNPVGSSSGSSVTVHKPCSNCHA
ncbi:MAG: twin-arginine translocation signal domain-containing protein [Actinomycetes bacterium]